MSAATFTEPLAALRALLADDDRAMRTRTTYRIAAHACEAAVADALPAMLDVCEALQALGLARAARLEAKAVLDKAQRDFYVGVDEFDQRGAADDTTREAAREEWSHALAAYLTADQTRDKAARRLAQLSDLLVKTETCDEPKEGEVE